MISAEDVQRQSTPKAKRNRDEEERWVAIKI